MIDQTTLRRCSACSITFATCQFSNDNEGIGCCSECDADPSCHPRIKWSPKAKRGAS